MRLPPIPPAELSAPQRALYDDMQAGISKGFRGFVTQRDDGALLGPWNPWLHKPVIGSAIWELTKAMSADSTLPEPVRQIAILVTGAHFHAGYELYAHAAVAEKDGLDPARIATIVAGQRPADLTPEEALAFDAAWALVNGGVLPELVYRQAVTTWGAVGAGELAYLVGLYCLVSVTLNAFDVRVPDAQSE